MTPRLAVIQFPGSNCEYETQKAAQSVGFDVEIVRWNADQSYLASFDAYILPGGFSYQDRVRAGAIASKMSVISVLIDAAGAGKPILGICNGCQILAESGLLPNTKGRHEVELGMGHNLRNQKPYGFVCDWVYVKPQFPEKSLFFKYFKESDVLPIPINHGEGRFVLPDDILKASECHAQFLFCDASGNVVENAPINPNGSMNNLAGLCNASGSVLAMMPHPERATFLRQIPLSIQSPWADKKREAFASGQDGAGPWQLVFAAMYDSVKVCVS